MAHDPVREVDQGLECQSGLKGALEARQEVENHACVEPADRNVFTQGPSGASNSGEEVHNHCGDHHFHCDGGEHSPVLKEHRDRGVEEVVNPCEWIEKGQSPETDQRETVRPDRLFKQNRHEVVHGPPAQRRDEQAHQVVDEHTADSAGRSSAHEILGDEVAHGIGQECPDKCRCKVPEGHIHRAFDMADRGHEVNRHQTKTDLCQWINPDRRFAPLQPLGFTEHKPHHRAQNHHLPGKEDEVGEPFVQNRMEGDAWDDPVEDSQKGCGDKPIGHSIGMNHPPSAWREDFNPGQRVVADHLEAHQKTAQHGNGQIDTSGNQVPAYQSFFHQIRVPGQIRRRGRLRLHVSNPPENTQGDR